MDEAVFRDIFERRRPVLFLDDPIETKENDDDLFRRDLAARVVLAGGVVAAISVHESYTRKRLREIHRETIQAALQGAARHRAINAEYRAILIARRAAELADPAGILGRNLELAEALKPNSALRPAGIIHDAQE